MPELHLNDKRLVYVKRLMSSVHTRESEIEDWIHDQWVFEKSHVTIVLTWYKQGKLELVYALIHFLRWLYP